MCQKFKKREEMRPPRRRLLGEMLWTKHRLRGIGEGEGGPSLAKGGRGDREVSPEQGGFCFPQLQEEGGEEGKALRQQLH